MADMSQPIPAEGPSLYVLIATCGRPRSLEETLSSLSRCEPPEGYSGLLVIENGTRQCEGTVAGLPGWMKARYLHSPRANKSLALNLGLAGLTRGLAVFFDDDLLLEDRRILAAYAQGARRFPGGRYFGGRMLPQYEVPPPPYLRPLLPLSARGLDYGDRPKAFDRHVAFLGINWAAYVEDLKAAGGFRKEHGPGSTTGATGQEMTMQLALSKLGVRPVYLPDCAVRHKVPASHCSVRWLRRRKYQMGLAFGLRNKAPFRKGLMAAATTVFRNAPKPGRRTDAALQTLVYSWASLFFLAGWVRGRLLPRESARS